MARKTRTKRSPEFKAKVALAAVQSQQTTAQLATLHGVHPIQITQWKKQLLAGAAAVFAIGMKIDTNQGLDIDPAPSGDPPRSSNTQEAAAAPEPSHTGEPASPETAPQPASSTEIKAAQPQSPVTQQHAPAPSDTQDTVALLQPSHAAQPASSEKPSESSSGTEMKPPQPPT